MKNRVLLVAAVLVSFTACTNSTEDNPGFTPESTTTSNSPVDGQTLFVQNCSACHQKDRDAVGPALKGSLSRWGGDKTRLYTFIKNSQDVIAKGDARAVAVKQQWGGNMPAFPQLTDGELDAIMSFIEQ